MSWWRDKVEKPFKEKVSDPLSGFFEKAGKDISSEWKGLSPEWRAAIIIAAFIAIGILTGGTIGFFITGKSATLAFTWTFGAAASTAPAWAYVAGGVVGAGAGYGVSADMERQSEEEHSLTFTKTAEAERPTAPSKKPGADDPPPVAPIPNQDQDDSAPNRKEDDNTDIVDPHDSEDDREDIDLPDTDVGTPYSTENNTARENQAVDDTASSSTPPATNLPTDVTETNATENIGIETSGLEQSSVEGGKIAGQPEYTSDSGIFHLEKRYDERPERGVAGFHFLETGNVYEETNYDSTELNSVQGVSEASVKQNKAGRTEKNPSPQDIDTTDIVLDFVDKVVNYLGIPIDRIDAGLEKISSNNKIIKGAEKYADNASKGLDALSMLVDSSQYYIAEQQDRMSPKTMEARDKAFANSTSITIGILVGWHWGPVAGQAAKESVGSFFDALEERRQQDPNYKDYQWRYNRGLRYLVLCKT